MHKKRRRFGIGFPDMVMEGRKNFSKRAGSSKYVREIADLHVFEEDSTPTPPSFSPWRLVTVLLIAFCITTVTVGRLFHLQVVRGESLRKRSDANRLTTKIIHAPRGIIYDRDGKSLVVNVPAFVKIEQGKAELVPYEEALQLEATQSALKRLEVQAVRDYPHKEVLSHVLGYTSEISQEELRQADFAKSYKLGDRIGRDGTELTYEQYLRGEDGVVYQEVDAVSNTQREIATTQPVEGKSLTLNLDLGLQVASYEALNKAVQNLLICCGVVIAQKPSTGEILSLVSLPSYDNNVFSGKLSQSQYETLLKDPNRPLFNRAVAGEYPPGSLYKIITAAAGLKNGTITHETKIQDTGVITLGLFQFPNWYWLSSGKTDGAINVMQAIARSNDIFFYKVGEWVGPDTLAQMARKMGLGMPTGIDLPGELDGLVPDTKWKEETRDEPWYPGDTYHVAIGQGNNLETPMQLNMLTAFVANNGTVFKPQLVKKVVDTNGKTIKTFEPQQLVSEVLDKKHVAFIREGMKMACTDSSDAGGIRGTGWPMFDFGITRFEKVAQATQAAEVQRTELVEVKKRIEVGCKTGTAEFGHPQNKTHAWFTVFAPYDNPEIAITVLLEAGGEGSNVAAPVAKEILEYFFVNRGN